MRWKYAQITNFAYFFGVTFFRWCLVTWKIFWNLYKCTKRKFTVLLYYEYKCSKDFSWQLNRSIYCNYSAVDETKQRREFRFDGNMHSK